MIKAPLNLLSEKLNRLNFFISHDEAGVSGLFIILASLSSLPDVCLETRTPQVREHPRTDHRDRTLARHTYKQLAHHDPHTLVTSLG